MIPARPAPAPAPAPHSTLRTPPPPPPPSCNSSCHSPLPFHARCPMPGKAADNNNVRRGECSSAPDITRNTPSCSPSATFRTTRHHWLVLWALGQISSQVVAWPHATLPLCSHSEAYPDNPPSDTRANTVPGALLSRIIIGHGCIADSPPSCELQSWTCGKNGRIIRHLKLVAVSRTTNSWR